MIIKRFGELFKNAQDAFSKEKCVNISSGIAYLKSRKSPGDRLFCAVLLKDVGHFDFMFRLCQVERRLAVLILHAQVCTS